MYEGKNPTALQSREWLVEALLVLMEERPYSGITVRDICGRADLSRQTFYNLFEGKDAVIRFCIRQCYAGMMGKLEGKPFVKLSDITEQVAETFYDNQKLMKLIVLHGLDYLLELELVSVLKVFAQRINTSPLGEMDQYATAFLSGAIAHMVLYWFRDEKPVTPQQLSKLLYRILTGDYFRVSVDCEIGGTDGSRKETNNT